MKSLRGLLCATAVALLLAACGSDREAAQRELDDINAVMRALSTDGARYAPAQYAEAERQRAELQFSYDQRDYAAVVRAAPDAMAAVQRMSAAASWERDTQGKSLGDEWAELARVVPGMVSDIQARLGAISAGKETPNGADISASQVTVADASAQWDVAQAAFSAGRREEALAIAREVRFELDTQARALGAGGRQAVR